MHDFQIEFELIFVRHETCIYVTLALLLITAITNINVRPMLKSNVYYANATDTTMFNY